MKLIVLALAAGTAVAECAAKAASGSLLPLPPSIACAYWLSLSSM